MVLWSVEVSSLTARRPFDVGAGRLGVASSVMGRVAKVVIR